MFQSASNMIMYKQICIHANTVQNSIHDTHQLILACTNCMHFKGKHCCRMTIQEVKVTDACDIMNLYIYNNIYSFLPLSRILIFQIIKPLISFSLIFWTQFGNFFFHRKSVSMRFNASITTFHIFLSAFCS